MAAYEKISFAIKAKQFLHKIEMNIPLPLQSVDTLRHHFKAYSAHSVCLCVCVCMGVSVAFTVSVCLPHSGETLKGHFGLV